MVSLTGMNSSLLRLNTLHLKGTRGHLIELTRCAEAPQWAVDAAAVGLGMASLNGAQLGTMTPARGISTPTHKYQDAQSTADGVHAEAVVPHTTLTIATGLGNLLQTILTKKVLPSSMANQSTGYAAVKSTVARTRHSLPFLTTTSTGMMLENVNARAMERHGRGPGMTTAAATPVTPVVPAASLRACTLKRRNHVTRSQLHPVLSLL